MNTKALMAPLALIGVGYLEKTTFSNNQYIAQLKLLPCYNAEGRTKDEVTLNCLVKSLELQSLFDALDYHCHQGCSVIVKFVAQYHEVSSTFSTMTDSDPEQLISIEATVSHVINTYIDGVSYMHNVDKAVNE